LGGGEGGRYLEGEEEDEKVVSAAREGGNINETTKRDDSMRHEGTFPTGTTQHSPEEICPELPEV
jgi:hypothetical protein